MAEQSPDPWRAVWRFATSDDMLVVLLIAIALGATLTAWIPQQPASDIDYSRWLSQMQARFGQAAPVIQTLGLFDITSSLTFRALLALLGGCLVLRLVEGIGGLRDDREEEEPDGEWQELPEWDYLSLTDDLRRRSYRVRGASSLTQVDRWPWSSVLPMVAHLGALLLLVGLILFQLLGWQVSDVILQEGGRVSLRGGQEEVTLATGGGLEHSPGVVAYLGERGPGIRAKAFNNQDELLELLLTPDAEPRTDLRIALTGETFFAIPSAELIVRLTPRSDQAYARVDIQIYNSPTGDIIAERTTEEGGYGEFAVAGVTLEFGPAPFARATAVHNPGRLPAALGLLLLTLGLLGSLAYSERRFWLRVQESTMEGIGSLPTWLCREGEDL